MCEAIGAGRQDHVSNFRFLAERDFASLPNLELLAHLHVLVRVLLGAHLHVLMRALLSGCVCGTEDEGAHKDCDCEYDPTFLHRACTPFVAFGSYCIRFDNDRDIQRRSSARRFSSTASRNLAQSSGCVRIFARARCKMVFTADFDMPSSAAISVSVMA